ncbi:MAG: 23S rRNA (guanosine(2251)-2'-O)-methyltransferase RlmB [Betaproteobacteria bacterium]|nr:MAG: 23S rRNA (guanosine(2251)-2'-O)-methyltransferase RlmB [Betaproteobacteria bacterium]
MKQVLHGFHAVGSRVRHHPKSIQTLYLDKDRRDKRMQDLVQMAANSGVRVVLTDAARLTEMAPDLAKRNQGVIALAEPVKLALNLAEVLDTTTEPPLFLVLDGVTDPHNLGACLRSAEAFGAHAVIAPKDRSASLTAVAIKAASGAADCIPFLSVTNLARSLREMKEHGILIVGADAEGTLEIFAADLSGATALILGAEGDGLRRLTREHCDLLVKIPMQGQVESLNVSVSAGVCLYEARRQRAIKAG